MLLTIITVCRNAEKDIAKTMNSVLAQSAPIFEYVIVDGASTDRTMAIVESFRPLFEQKGIPFTAVSEKDHGIYNAMNKGVRLSSGEWLNFMNAGDRFFSASTIERLRDLLTESDAHVIYGSTVYLRNGMMRPAAPLKLEQKFSRKLPFCHQSSFVRASLLRQRPYDERYKVSGDYNFFLWAYTQGYRFQETTEFVSLFETGGYSATHRPVMRRERSRTQFACGLIHRWRFIRLMALSVREQITEAFLSAEEKQRRLAAIYEKETGWVKSDYGD